MTTVTPRRTIDELIESKRGILLDVGCGFLKQEGFIGMDVQDIDGVDIVHDWNDFPWPIPDDCVLTLVASHVIEHVNPAEGHFMRWMDECWRVLKPNGQLAIGTPYAGSRGFWQDPTHCNGCTENTFAYWDPTHPSGFFDYYRPRPFTIELVTFHREGNLEVVLRKRVDA